MLLTQHLGATAGGLGLTQRRLAKWFQTVFTQVRGQANRVQVLRSQHQRPQCADVCILRGFSIRPCSVFVGTTQGWRTAQGDTWPPRTRRASRAGCPEIKQGLKSSPQGRLGGMASFSCWCFGLEVILELQQSCETITEFWYVPYPASPNVSFSRTHGTRASFTNSPQGTHS